MQCEVSGGGDKSFYFSTVNVSYCHHFSFEGGATQTHRHKIYDLFFFFTSSGKTWAIQMSRTSKQSEVSFEKVFRREMCAAQLKTSSKKAKKNLKRNWNVTAKHSTRCELEKYAFSYLFSRTNQFSVRFILRTKRYVAKKGLFLAELNHLNSFNTVFACDSFGDRTAEVAALSERCRYQKQAIICLIVKHICIQMWQIMCQSNGANTTINQIIHLITHSASE